MNTGSLKQPLTLPAKIKWTAAALASLFMAATVCTDLVFSYTRSTSFYLSESVLFSSLWLLFLPLLYIQALLFTRFQGMRTRLLIVLALAATHMLLYPLLVWVISGTMFEHRFAYGQTLVYGFTAYALQILVIYLVQVVTGIRKNEKPLIAQTKAASPPLTSLIVTDSNNQKTIIQTTDIYYISASTPYINIHHRQRRFLYAETLRSMQNRLDNGEFTRIHKSCIVNISHITAYRSRMNGDYDLTLSNGDQLRVSRHYAAAFKEAVARGTRLTVK